MLARHGWISHQEVGEDPKGSREDDLFLIGTEVLGWLSCRIQNCPVLSYSNYIYQRSNSWLGRLDFYSISNQWETAPPARNPSPLQNSTRKTYAKNHRV